MISLMSPSKVGFTHNDPFEDTESDRWLLPRFRVCSRFTHNDPFEDTESTAQRGTNEVGGAVSPITIRSRILKDQTSQASYSIAKVSPITIRSRILKVDDFRGIVNGHGGFTHNDPFEDTERRHPADRNAAPARFHP